MKTPTALAALLTLVFLSAGTAVAQPGPAASGPQRMGQGMGPGMGHGPGMGPRFGADVTPGWSMMSAEERAAHQKAMSEAKTQAECVAARDQHHQAMAERAKARGQTMPARPRRDVCAGLPK
jgi:hypothetical protein